MCERVDLPCVETDPINIHIIDSAGRVNMKGVKSIWGPILITQNPPTDHTHASPHREAVRETTAGIGVGDTETSGGG